MADTTDLEEQKKLLLPILQRAEEIQAVEPRMAYYCRLYALKKGLELAAPAKEIAGLIKATFGQCERDKPAVQPNEAADRLHCENFALRVFARADKVDRAGRADMNTCKAFYAAAIFLQVLEQFLDKGEELEVAAPDLLEKTRYALWRAAEIRKALREGRAPAPPPDLGAGGMPGGADDPFAGPAYEAGSSAPAAPDAGGATDRVASSTDDFLALPKPPSTTPPAGSTGLVAPAAAAGPRYRPGSRVWCCGGGGGGPPEEGTVGMVVSAIAGPGGQAVYKVALADRLLELPDSQLAPSTGPGARLLFVPGIGEAPLPASVIAVNLEAWPVTYLLQLDDGRTLDTDAGRVTTMAPGDPAARSSTGGGAASTAAAAAAAAGYPRVGSVGTLPPAAPPLVGGHTPQQPHVAAPPQPPVSQPTPPPAAAQPPQQLPQQQRPSQPVRPQQPPPPLQPSHVRQPAAHAPPPPAAAAAAAAAGGLHFPAPGAYSPSTTAIAEAAKAAKYAASSLAFDDVAGGIKFLSDALRLLTQQPAGR